MSRRWAGRLVVLAGSVALLVVVAGRLPRGTDPGSVGVRLLAGLGVGLLIVLVVWRMLRSLSEPPPPAPEVVEADEAEVVYECRVCGTRVRLELAATGKAPRHCGETMEPAVRPR